jgi:hypothetical protein
MKPRPKRKVTSQRKLTSEERKLKSAKLSLIHAQKKIAKLEKKEEQIEYEEVNPNYEEPRLNKEAPHILFEPNKGPQTDFLAAPEREVLYGGAAGGGKSFALIVDPLRYCTNNNFNALILRRTNDELRE